MPSRPLPTTPQVAWDTPALFGVGLVEDDAGAAALYQELHTPLAAAGVDGVKVCSLVITPVYGVQVGCAPAAALAPAAAALRREAATPRNPASPACSPTQQSPPLSPSTGGRTVWRCGHGRRHGRWTGARAQVHAGSGGLGGGALPLQRLHQLHVPQHREPLPVPHHRRRACLRRLLPRQTRVAHGAPTQRRHRPFHSCACAQHAHMPACASCASCASCACACTHMHAHARMAWVHAGPPRQRGVQLCLHRRDRAARLGHVPLEARSRRAARRRTRGETPPPPATRCNPLQAATGCSPWASTQAAAPMHPPRLQPLCSRPGAPRLQCDTLCRWAAARST